MDTTTDSRSTYFFPPQISLSIQIIIVAVVFTYLCCIFQRLYFHPLSKIPGPRLAAATSWYEFYYNVIRDGSYIKNFEQMHRDYNSSVIRIAPDMVHVNDPDFFSTPHEHRLRRQKVNSMFSTKAVDSMAPDVLAIAQKAANIMMKRGEEKRPVDMYRLSRSISSEVLFKILFDEPMHLLDSQEEQPELLAGLDTFLGTFWLMRAFPVIGWLAINLPQSLTRKLIPGFKSLRDDCERWARMSVARQNSREITKNDSSSNTVFDLLLTPTPGEPRSEFSIPDLVDEAFLFVFAGTDTTGNTITNAFYYILSSPSVYSKILDELTAHGITSPETFDCNVVQRLPYLVNSSSQGKYANSHYSGRCSSAYCARWGVVVDGYFMPAGTSISQSIHSLHHNASIFPSPEKFDPERWIKDEEKELEKYFAPFSKGSRACLGMNLANQEIYVVIALFCARFEIELYDTDSRSMEWADRGNTVNRSPVKLLVKRDRWANN
ncbi:hypothetical protein H4I96_01952 [Botrytis cinerea]